LRDVEVDARRRVRDFDDWQWPVNDDSGQIRRIGEETMGTLTQTCGRGTARVLFALVAATVGFLSLMSGVAHAAVVSSWTLATDASDSVDGNSGSSPNVAFTDSAAVFNGTDSRITVLYNPNLSPGTADVTASVQINTTYMPGTGGADFDLIRSSPTGKMYKVELFPHGRKAQAQCIFHGSLNGTATRITLHAGPSLKDGEWHTITCTKTANQVTLTIATNGVVIGTWATDVAIGTIKNRKNSVFALGYKPVPGGTDGDFFHGQMRNATVSIG
jgi:hypothetical protein